MKGVGKKSFSVLLVFVLLLACTQAIFAGGTVTYKGDAEKFVFTPGSGYSATDLFTDFKGVMPGDSITQRVQIKMLCQIM